MCTNNIPIRNTLHGYIVSPSYPHPMADNLKCSISIGMNFFSKRILFDSFVISVEADPTMYIELSVIQIHLQEAIRCRAEYIEVFGYDSSDQKNTNENNVWKSYHTWCGTTRSLNNPPPNTRYLIASNSLYMSLQTAASKKPRYFKIRYKSKKSSINRISAMIILSY